MVRGIRTFSQDKELVEARRREIVRCASRVFIEKGYENAGMREIARSFGKSTGSLYHYVGSKEDILYLILDFVVTNQAEFLGKIKKRTAKMQPAEALREAIKIYTKQLDAYADMYVFVNHIMVVLEKPERKMMLAASHVATDFFQELVERGINAGVFHNPNPRMVAWNITIVGSSWVNRRWFWKKNVSLTEYIKQQTDNIMRTLEVKES
ncbi:MAG: TetR/AcrR family transcriptional regulator [Dehalococcoidales bacterium]|nr:TetR/AcrR family transcriptional regulator [Dehalococcoidales bacterium]